MSHALKLHRPLVALDLETTGLDPANDRIIEICCVKLMPPDASRITWCRRVDPEQAIGADATRVHGITAADLVGAPRFAELADPLRDLLQGCDLTGFNVDKFDLPFLRAEFSRLGQTFPDPDVHVVDTAIIFRRREPRDLAGALRFYCGRTLVDAHSAKADAHAAADLLVAQVERYADLPRDAAGLHVFCHPHNPLWLDADGKVAWRGGEAALTFGKHRGRSLRELAQHEPDYLRWICVKDFGDQVRTLCAEALVGNFPACPTDMHADGPGAAAGATTAAPDAANGLR